MVHCRVMLLDGKDFTCEIDKQAKGRDLFEKACQHINLIEKDYFALSHRDGKNVKLWLKNDKKIGRQIGNDNWLFSFEVKFYPSEPSILQEELSRYQLYLQLRRDIVSAKLPCSFMSYALLGSYIVQSQCGDYESSDHGAGTRYINHMTFAPEQSEELLEKIAELHKTHRGLLPADAEFSFLENAKKLALYGVDLHMAKDNTGNNVEIGVCAVGLLLYKNQLRTSRLTWAKILSFSYKWNVFSVKIRPAENDSGATNLEYKLANDKLTKRLWRIAVEHHTFFRLREAGVPSHGLMARFSPKYQYSGRTLYQAQLASSTSVSGTLDRSATSSLMSSRRRVGGSKSLESVLAGYSTERSEKYALDNKRIATIDLKNRQPKSAAGSPTYSTVDKNRSSVDLVGSATYGNDYTKYQQASMAMNRGTAVGPYGTVGMYKSQPIVYTEIGNKRNSGDFGTGLQNRSQIGNLNGPSVKLGVDGKPLPPYQDDRLTERGYGRPMGDRDTWDPYTSGSFIQSSIRAYNAPDGTVVTEYSTSRNGISEHHHYAGNYYENAIDHDRALSEAILAVTSMNADLSVEKIEIVRNNAVSH